MPMSLLGVATDGGEGPRGGAEGAAGPYQRTTQSLLLHIVPLSGALKHWRTRRLNCPSCSSTWGPHQSWDQMSSISSRSRPLCKGKTEGAILLKSPQQKTMKGGSSGGDE